MIFTKKSHDGTYFGKKEIRNYCRILIIFILTEPSQVFGSNNPEHAWYKLVDRNGKPIGITRVDVILNTESPAS